jgi:dihydrodipicolinate synthase/N-acetylneuraminate lyase
MKIHGIIPPLATPMKDNEDLDLPRLRWFLDYQISQGVHGIFVLGTNSEFYALDERENRRSSPSPSNTSTVAYQCGQGRGPKRHTKRLG